MFSRSAHLYDAIYSFKEYAAEAARLRMLVEERVPDARTLLDVACGTGKHLAELSAWYRVEGADVDAALLAIARKRLPGVPLHEADMVTLDLGRRFDVVTCLFSSIGYVLTRDRLRAAFAALARHVAPGGLLVVEPWIFPEDWEGDGIHALFIDEPGLKVARMNTSPPAGPTVTLEFHYLVGTPDDVETFTERHELGLFGDAEYRAAFGEAGLDVDRDDEGLTGRGLYVGVRGA